MNIFITGINGFIGHALALDLFARGHRVFGSVSGPDKVSLAPRCGVHIYVVRLNEEFDPTIFRDIDVLVHCAHDFRKGRSEANREGTKKLAKAGARQGIKSQVFISSYSAHQGATSEYGRAKLELEQFFSRSNYMVVKPGLVIGDGGIFAKICGLFQDHLLVPLIDGGRGQVPVISLHDLVASTVQLIEQPKPGIFSLHNVALVTLKEFLQNIKFAGNFKTLMLPVPFAIVNISVHLLVKLGVSMQIDSENLMGFQANQAAHSSTDLTGFIPRPMTLCEMIDVAFKSACASRPNNMEQNYDHSYQNK